MLWSLALALAEDEVATDAAEVPFVEELRFQNDVVPDYPLAAREEGLSASCTVAVDVDEFGVTSNPVVREDCPAVFHDTLVAAANMWRFYPHKDGLYPVPSRTEVTVGFEPPVDVDEVSDDEDRDLARRKENWLYARPHHPVAGGEDVCKVSFAVNGATLSTLKIKGCSGAYKDELKGDPQLFRELARQGRSSIEISFEVLPCDWPELPEQAGDRICVSRNAAEVGEEHDYEE